MAKNTHKGFAPLEIVNSHGQNNIQGQQLIQRESLTGFASLYLVLLTLFLMAAIVTSSFVLVSWQQRISRNTQNSVQAYWAAEAGLEDAAYRIITGKQYLAGYTLAVGESTANVTVSGNDTKTVTTKSESRNVFRNIQAVLVSNTTTPQFRYGVQVGQGGVTMGQNSRIEGTGGAAGNFYSNGAVIGDSGATITGDVTVATGISLAEESAVCNADQVVGQTNPQIDFSQSFRASDSKPLAQVSLYVKKVGSPDDRTIRIVNDVSGVPGTVTLASATFNASLVTGSYGWIDIVFSSPVTVTQNNTYWIILDANQSSTKYWVWCKDSSAGYANGQIKYSKDWDHDPWTGISGDLAFKTYLGTGTSSINNAVVYGTVRANSITNSKICGDAYYQSVSTIDVSSKSFLDSPTNPTCGGNPLTPGTGYPNQPDPPVSPMPISQANIDRWKSDAANEGIIMGNCGDSDQSGGSNPACTILDKRTLSIGPKKITGNLVLTKKQTLTITGTLYLQGNIDIDSSSGVTIKCDQSFSGNSCIIVTDGWVHIKNNATFQGSGVSGSYVMFLTTLPGCNGGSQQPQCTHHNGAIDLHNNATGAIFYATSSLANLHNGVNVSEIVAYKLQLDNNTVVTYEQGLLNAQFSSGPGVSWEVTSWKEVE